MGITKHNGNLTVEADNDDLLTVFLQWRRADYCRTLLEVYFNPTAKEGSGRYVCEFLWLSAVAR